MTRQQVLELIAKQMTEQYELMDKKGADYSGDKPFGNFELIEQISNGKITVEMGFLVRICDKVSRLGQVLFTENKVKDETVIDTLNDLANYSQLLIAYLKTK